MSKSPLINRSIPSWLKTVLIYSPVLLSVFIMIPRLISPQFGLLDDGATLARSHEITTGDWSPGDEAIKGRFRPAYWLYHASIFYLTGESPFAFFFGNLLVLAATIAGLIAVILILSSNPFQAWVTGALFALASPVIETFYTLSKAEHLQLLWIVLSLLAVLLVRRGSSIFRVAFLSVLAILFLVLANVSKETSLVMVPIGLGWLALGFLRRGTNDRNTEIKVRGAYFLACLLAAGVYFGWRSFFLTGGLTAGAGYASQYQFTVDRILASSTRWFGWLLRDFLFLVPLALAWIIVIIKTKSSKLDPLYLDILLWISAWIALFLPWQFMVEYYMLPAAMGFAAVAGLLLKDLLKLSSIPSRPWRVLIYTCLIFSGVLWGMTLFNNYTNGYVQLTVDATNSDMIAFIDDQAPENSKVLVNLPAENQYIREIRNLLIYHHDRPDIQVLPLDIQSAQLDQESTLVITPYINNKPLLSVRLGVYEEGSDAWNQELTKFLGADSQPIYQAEQWFRLANFDLPRLLCPLIDQLDFCISSSPVFDRRLFTYGWEVYAP